MEKYLKYKQKYVKRIIGGAVEETAAARTPITSVIKSKDDESFEMRYDVGDLVLFNTNGGFVIGRVINKENKDRYVIKEVPIDPTNRFSETEQKAVKIGEEFVYGIEKLTYLAYDVLTPVNMLYMEEFKFIGSFSKL